ncbi:hypothetical protein CUZ56_02212 [Saezia sanguinis]|uniref:Uncharacterized protein n=1 Tax=Saezia sanguinis TaxID=1965230 RepID=A0A433SBV3_9BURK|nr:ankyrin repeat domain-containing protein [Saezia sanguinis]RUS66134.1 hypothetical protein CUZ56_02212 [Saezia sanguinis]
MKRHYLIHYGMLVLLLLTGISSQADSRSDFLDAVKADDVSQVKTMLSRGVDPNTKDASGQCALVLALQSDALKVADVLIADQRTDVNYLNSHDESPLMMAAIKGLLPQAQALIAREALVNKTGWTPLHYAASQNDPALIALMLENYAYIDAESPNSTTPLMMAAHYGSDAGVELLLQEGADPELKNQQGLTAYDFAKGAERAETAEIILKAMRARQPAGW